MNEPNTWRLTNTLFDEKLKSGEVCIPYIASRNQHVDIHTKGLSRSLSQTILSKLGIKNIFNLA